MNPRYKFGVWLGVRNNSAECFVETAEGVFRAREVRRIEHQGRWDKEAMNNVIGVSWRNADGKWTVDRQVTQIDTLPPPPPVPFEGARVQRERITRIGLRYHCRMPGLQCDQIWKARAQAHSDPCRASMEGRLKTTPEVAERLDRRSEVLNEALAREVERNVRRREEIGSTAGELAVPQELKDMPTPPLFRSEKKTCNESSDSSCEQWQQQTEGSRAVAETPTQQNSTEVIIAKLGLRRMFGHQHVMVMTFRKVNKQFFCDFQTRKCGVK